MVKQKKPRLLPRHTRARLNFALKYADWTIEDWKRVIFYDETKINRLASDGRQWVWKKRGGPLIAQHVTGTLKFGGGSLMVWGCMTYHGVGYACRIDGRMNSELYTCILGDEFGKMLDFYEMDRNRALLQQDRRPKAHVSCCAPMAGNAWNRGAGLACAVAGS